MTTLARDYGLGEEIMTKWTAPYNVGTMLRTGIDGTWRVASPQWEKALGQRWLGAAE